jgi:hypothetical protein
MVGRGGGDRNDKQTNKACALCALQPPPRANWNKRNKRQAQPSQVCRAADAESQRQLERLAWTRTFNYAQTKRACRGRAIFAAAVFCYEISVSPSSSQNLRQGAVITPHKPTYGY